MDYIVSVLSDSLADVGTQALGVISEILPAALAIVGAVLVVRIGIRVFYSIAGK